MNFFQCNISYGLYYLYNKTKDRRDPYVKKLSAIILAAILLAAMTACQKPDTSSETETTSYAATLDEATTDEATTAETTASMLSHPLIMTEPLKRTAVRST